MHVFRTHVFPAGVNALRRNSYEIKYIPVAGTSAETIFKYTKKKDYSSATSYPYTTTDLE